MTAPGGFSSGDVLTAANMNDLPAGIVGGSGVGWDTFSSNTGITTTPLEILSCTFTAQASRLYQIDFSAYFYNASTSLTYRSRIEGDGSTLNIGDAPAATSQFVVMSYSVLWTPSSGSRTVTVDAYTTTGTGGVAAAGTYGPWLIIKDVGPA